MLHNEHSPSMDGVSRLLQLFAERGGSEYGGEAVTQLEHALQCAHLAEQAGAAPEVIVAALLHDVGHLLHDLPQDAPAQGIDDHHENSGFRFLQQHFPAEVTEPVRLHVEAKRYLCRQEPGYLAQLSEPSRMSLNLQGGVMSVEEAAAFSALPHCATAVAVRRWDDLAKVTGLPTPPLSHFEAVLRAVCFD